MKKAQTSVFCWPAIERMQQMHQLILNGEYPNCTTMAKEFEMSVRTLKRNIDFMKTRLNLPIGFDLKPHLSNEDRTAIASGREGFGNWQAHRHNPGYAEGSS